MGHAKSPGLSVKEEQPARTRNEKKNRMMIAFILPPGFWFNGKFIRTICSNVLKDSVGFKWCFYFFLLCQRGWYPQISNGNTERVMPKVHFLFSPIDAKIPGETENI
jgi:hypothetical protein